MEVGHVEGSKPRIGHQVREEFYRTLNTQDIDGAQSGSLNKHLKQFT